MQGRSYTLPEGEFIIGRSCKSHLWLDDPEVSRHHCILSTSGTVSEIRDLESRNKTLVNGQAIGSVHLEAADEITVGCSVFRYSPAEVDAGEHSAGGVTVLRPSDSLLLSASPDPVPSAGLQRDLKTLLRLSNILHALRGIAGVGSADYDGAIRAKLEGLLQDISPAVRVVVVPPDADMEAVREACLHRAALLTPDPKNCGRMLLAAPIIVRSDIPAVIVSDWEG